MTTPCSQQEPFDNLRLFATPDELMETNDPVVFSTNHVGSFFAQEFQPSVSSAMICSFSSSSEGFEPAQAVPTSNIVEKEDCALHC